MKTKSIVLLAIGCFLLAVGIVVVYMWRNGFTITETGTIGDGFNGLLAPFISFAGALLVYLSFRAQIRANYIITSQWQYDLLLRLLEDIERNYEKMELVRLTFGMERTDFGGIQGQTHRSEYMGEQTFEALRLRKWDTFENTPAFLNELHGVIWEFLFAIDRVEMASIEDKEYLRLRCFLFYSKNLQAQLTFIRTELSKEDKKTYSFPAIIAAVDKLTTKTFDLQTTGSWAALIK